MFNEVSGGLLLFFEFMQELGDFSIVFGVRRVVSFHHGDVDDDFFEVLL